jgi:DNA-binding response OmpR family regulator
MGASRPILVVEDDDTLRHALVEQITQGGRYQAFQAATLHQAMQLLAAPDARFDAIILDVAMPDGDGRDFCAQMRQSGHRMPIIMLSGSASEEDIVRGLNAGANDYLAKPFRAAELLARMQAQLRVFDSTQDAVLAIGPFQFRPSAQTLQTADRSRRIRLTSKEVAILKFLLSAGGEAVSRQVLLNEVWGYNAGVTTHTLETHIYRLRQKIEADPNNCDLLLTAPGGYRLNTAWTAEPAGITPA